MSRHSRQTGAKHDRTNPYSEITDKIITELEAGRLPWIQPWRTAAAKAPLDMPRKHRPVGPIPGSTFSCSGALSSNAASAA